MRVPVSGAIAHSSDVAANADQADDEDLAAAVAVAERPAEHEQRPEREQVPGEHPLEVAEVGVQVAGDGGERGVHDRAVEERHPRAEHRGGDHPATAWPCPCADRGEPMRAVNHAPGRISPWPAHQPIIEPGTHVEREGVGPPRRPSGRGRARSPLHRSPPRPRGHVAAGVRRPAPRRARRAPARPHRGHDGPQRPDRRTSTCRSPTRSPRKQMEVLAANCAEFGIRLYPMGAPGQGIVHVIGPELGLTQPGMTIVCGDSHTSTHGAFGALAFGIGTSEVEHVLATQTLPQAQAGHHGGHRRRRAARVASPRRTSRWRSSTASAPAAGSARSSSTAVRRSARCRWKAG